MGWIGVDLDGTLAKYSGWQQGLIGEPIEPMVKRVRSWLSVGKDVRIVTARVAGEDKPERDVPFHHKMIQEWCKVHLGQVLPITCCKDYDMEVLYDDRAIQVEANTGRIIQDVK